MERAEVGARFHRESVQRQRGHQRRRQPRGSGPQPEVEAQSNGERGLAAVRGGPDGHEQRAPVLTRARARHCLA